MLAGRAGRRWAAPVLRPFERRLARAGANPADAPLWLLGTVLVVGLLLVTLTGWVSGTVVTFMAMRGARGSDWVRLILGGAISLVSAALIVRVIGSWVGAGRYHKWMRPVYFVTDWIVEPIRKRLPPMGAIDLSPFVAYIVLLLLQSLLLSWH